jgi:hypothetical protein
LSSDAADIAQPVRDRADAMKGKRINGRSYRSEHPSLAADSAPAAHSVMASGAS